MEEDLIGEDSAVGRLKSIDRQPQNPSPKPFVCALSAAGNGNVKFVLYCQDEIKASDAAIGKIEFSLKI